MKKFFNFILHFIISIFVWIIFLWIWLYIVSNFIQWDFSHSVWKYDILLLLFTALISVYWIIIYWYSAYKKKYNILKYSFIVIIFFWFIFWYLIDKIEDDREFNKISFPNFSNEKITIDWINIWANIKFEIKWKNKYIKTPEIKIPKCFSYEWRLKILEKNMEKESKLNYGKYWWKYYYKKIHINIFNPYWNWDSNWPRKYNWIILPKWIYLKSDWKFCKYNFLVDDWKKWWKCFSENKNYESNIFSKANNYKTLWIPKHKYKNTEFKMELDFEKISLINIKNCPYDNFNPCFYTWLCDENSF